MNTPEENLMLRIYVSSSRLEDVQCHALRDLLPHAFASDALNSQE